MTASTILKATLIAVLGFSACKGGGSDGAKAGGPPGGPSGPGGGRGGMGGAAQAFAVEVADVKAETVVFSTSAVGSIDAFERMQITARVSGGVDTVRFREGDEVTAGQILVDIDTARYGLTAQSARAQLERAKAALSEADAALLRRETADRQSPGLIRGEELETYRTRVRTAHSDVDLANASVQRADLDRRDATVRAPLAGTIETRDIRTGQYANPGTLIATLLRREPLLLRFALAEADAPSLKVGQVVTFRVAGEPAPREAVVKHVGGAADPTSRLVPAIADIPSGVGVRTLRPGAFAEVVVPLGETREAPVIPQSAVRPSEKGMLCYVVEGEVAKERMVQLGQRTSDGRVEIRAGLKVGDKLVVRGYEALRDGAKVRLPGEGQPPAAVAPAKEGGR